MSYESCEIDGLFVVRWGKTPEVPDVASYCAAIVAARQRQGKPLVGLFLMPPDSSAPDQAFRKSQAEHLPEIMRNLSFAVAVFEGDGFIASLKRSALVAILLLAPKRYPIYVRSTIHEALVSNPPAAIGFDGVSAIAELKRRKFC